MRSSSSGLNRKVLACCSYWQCCGRDVFVGTPAGILTVGAGDMADLKELKTK